MLFAGIDIAKHKHDVSVIDSSGQIVLKHLKFQNSKPGFDTFLSKMKELKEKHGSEIVFAMEDTGHYGLVLQSFIGQHFGNPVKYNPLMVKKFGEGLSLRKTKTDKKDALLIARKLMADFATIRPTAPAEDTMAELKFATRHRNRLTRNCSDAKVQCTRVLDMLFPELASVANPHSQSVRTLLKACPSAKSVSMAEEGFLEGIKYMSAKTAERISAAAKASIGIESKALELELVLAVRTIEHLEGLIAEVDRQIEGLMEKIGSPIVTVKGIGLRLASVILAEIRSIDNFGTPAQLQAYAGLEPSVNQSGQSDGTGKMVKRGSPHLRWALMQAARLVAIYSPGFKAYLKSKTSQGKHYNVAITHVAKKLIRVIFYLMKNNQPFDESLLR